MNNFDSLRPVTRRHFWDDYRSPLTCVLFPTSSGSSASGDTTDLGIEPVFRAAGPVVSAEAVGATVSLTWTEVPGAYAYVIYRSTVEAGPFSILLAGLVTRSYVDTPGIPGTFFYRVTAIEPNFGESEVSNVASATV